ncbi:MAG: hypothetical protein ACP5N2_05575 [Candidatus Nanoarchaeia archaeon]
MTSDTKMKYEEVLEKIKSLEFDKKLIICKQDNVELYVLRPSKLSARFKNYDINKNFQIFLKEDNREFKPNHLRIMIDLSLRARSRPDLRSKLSKLFDNIFYHKDPEVDLEDFNNEKFEHYLNDLHIIANLAQLFIIEQEHNYNKPSRFDPPTLFFQGWIRNFINNADKEIDNLCMSVCNRQTPTAKYVDKENKKDKKYDPELQPQWYLESQ